MFMIILNLLEVQVVYPSS